jgi:orotidine-5'-phosphate decarboxylase
LARLRALSNIKTLQPSPVIVALDFESREVAIELVDKLGASSNFYKVGLQILIEAGPELIRELIQREKIVFLDLKLHEIPNSVTSAVTAAGKLGVSFVTVHASAGSAVLKAAVLAASPFPNLKVLALTVITSLSDADLPEIGLAPAVREQVLRLVDLALSAGCHGVVASAQEASVIEHRVPKGFYLVTPGIHSQAPAAIDQARVATPHVAGLSGATHIIIGRAITKATRPLQAFEEILAVFSAARATRQSI